MAHDTIHICERCRSYRPLFYVRSVDEYLCEECIMILAREQPIATEESEGET